MTVSYARWLFIVALGFGPSVSWAGETPTTSRSWLERLWGKPESGSSNRSPSLITQPLSDEAKAEAIDAEQRAWDRRMQVCWELRRIALERKDEALLRQVDELERQANLIYTQRTAALGVKKSPAPAASVSLQSPANNSSTMTTIRRNGDRGTSR